MCVGYPILAIVAAFEGRHILQTASELLPGRMLRTRAARGRGKNFAVSRSMTDGYRWGLTHAPLLTLYEGTLHGEGPAWQVTHHRLVWSDVPNRRLLGWYPDGHVEVLIDGTWFMNGNAVEVDGTLVHCEHGRRCISRGGDYEREPEPTVTHYQGKRINSPNDIAVAPDGTIWFTDPTFGIVMPNQGALPSPNSTIAASIVLIHGPAIRSGWRISRSRTVSLSPPTARRSTCPTPRYRLAKYPDIQPERSTRSSPSTSAREARFRTGASSAKPTTAIPTASRSMRAAGCGRARRTACISGQPDRRKLGFVSTPAVVSNCAFGGPDGQRLFIAATNICSRSILSAELMKMSVGIADQRVDI